jgi:hypothetical protein
MGAIVPFHRTGSGGGPRVRASGRVKGVLHPADLLQQSEALRDARRKLAECWEMRAESRRIQRDYEERQKLIEKLMDGLGI